MPTTDLTSALGSLQGDQASEIDQGVRWLRERLAALPEQEFRDAVEALCALFYVDTRERPDLGPSLDLAVEALAAAGPRVVERILESMQGSDIKSHYYLAITLGRIGRPSLPALRRFLQAADDPYGRSFVLFALGKIRDPDVRDVLPEVIGALADADKEVRDSAARTLGKFAEFVPANLLSTERRDEIFKALFGALADFQPAVRAKAIRSLGKLVRAGYLTPEQEERVAGAARSILGEDDRHEWDRAYIVRREAEEALRHVIARGGGRTDP